MSEFSVQLDTLELIKQLAERQGEHIESAKGHLNLYATLGDVGGLIMQFLGPMYHEGRDNAMTGFDQAQTVLEAIAETAEESSQAYLEADEACRSALEDAVAGSGIDVPAQSPPGSVVELPTASGLGGFDAEVPTGPGGPAWDNISGVVDTAAGGFRDAGQAGLTPALDRLAPARAELSPGMQRVEQMRLQQPFDHAVTEGVNRAWGWADDRFGNPDASATLRQRFEDRQLQWADQAYFHGREMGSTSSAGPTSWVDDNLTVRSWQTTQDVVGAYQQTAGAIDAIGTTAEATESQQFVSGVGAGPDNTSTYDWAENR